MAKGPRGGRRSGPATQAQAPQAPKAQQQPATTPQTGAASFGNMDDAYAKTLRNNVDDRYDPDVTDAIKLYISNSDPNGDGFSHSQNLNYKLDNGMKLNPTEKFIDDNIQAGMHDIGKNVQLTRYCHDDILKQCGISDYSSMTEGQLKNKLVGLKFQTTAYTSYSYDTSKNPFRVGAAGGGGREVTMKFDAKSTTKMVFGAKSQAEIVVNKGTAQVIKDVYFDGTTATPRGKAPKPRIVIVTESA